MMKINLNIPFTCKRKKKELSQNHIEYIKKINNSLIKKDKIIKNGYCSLKFVKYCFKILYCFREIEIYEINEFFNFIINLYKINDWEICMFIFYLIKISNNNFYYKLNFRSILNIEIIDVNKYKILHDKMIFVLFIITCSKLYLNENPFEGIDFSKIVKNISIFKNEIYFFNKLINLEIKGIIYSKLNTIYQFIKTKNYNELENSLILEN